MTVASETSKSGPYTGNGVTTIFAYGFRILDKAHLKVTRDENNVETVLVVDTDYIVAGVGDTGGGQIALVAAPTASQTITIVRNVPFTQEMDLENQGPYFADTVESAFDLAVMRDQQLIELVDENREIVDESAANIADVLASISALTNFADIYLGPKAVAPTLRNNGSPIQSGDMYFDTTVHQLKVWSGTAWLGPGTGDMRGSNNLSDVADTAQSWRNLGGFDLSAVVNLTAASALTASAFGKLHFLTGTTVNFTTTLPTPVGNAGKVIGFIVGSNTEASKLYTLTTPAGAIGRSGASIVMWANESVLLRSNGVNWQVLEAKQIPFLGKLTRTTDLNLTPSTRTEFTFNAASDDPTGLNLCYVGSRFVAPRAGSYLFTLFSYQTATGASFNQNWLSLGADVNVKSSGTFSFTGTVNAGTVYGPARITAAAGQSIGATANVDGTTPKVASAAVPATLDFSEVCPSW
ncbi:hypothetical protein IVB18_26160 [Bradyrhizobium sp. 186]|uniref:hypothetical protein n=1 Tax=Bradyrhizobium sp. 186 TaxID=2782654 RepID=UPI002001A92E|nr:hypothetical protein [Bradyrhizobium sp. 186]UPK31816.1 hypothetical protein IVB18_26160 [Bradyrhizobium sp. 186]